MASTNANALEKQLSTARRRLFLGTFLATLAWAGVAALVLGVVWFAVQPLVLPKAGIGLRWGVLGGLLGAAGVSALLLALRWAPSQVAAALELDSRFGLKERVTTSLMLGPAQAASSAGQALLADAHSRVAPLRVGDRFPVAVPWRPTALVPLAVLALVLLALLWGPRPGPGTVEAKENTPLPPEKKAAVDRTRKQIDEQLRKRSKDPTA